MTPRAANSSLADGAIVAANRELQKLEALKGLSLTASMAGSLSPDPPDNR